MVFGSVLDRHWCEVRDYDDYVFNGDTLLATVDQQTASGVATGTAKTRYVHPDHLGSTNVVTDENGNLVQTLDYLPYGATRISVATSTNEKRKYIDQFSDDSGLSYLNARYYSPTQGQFLTQDPTFLALGNPNQPQQLTQQQQQKILGDPQILNSYGYARDNLIVNKDATGLISTSELELFYKALNGVSGLQTFSSYDNAVLSTSGKSSQQQAADQAQFKYDFGTFSAKGTTASQSPNRRSLDDEGRFKAHGPKHVVEVGESPITASWTSANRFDRSASPEGSVKTCNRANVQRV